MKWIVDCGGTSCKWACIRPNGEVEFHKTSGFNPKSHEWETFDQQLNPDWSEQNAQSITFYGAGITTDEEFSILRWILTRHFDVDESDVTVYPDIMAICHGPLRSNTGIAAILGTGANAIFYDGHMHSGRPSLGYLVGDSGSGADLGRRFLKAYFQTQLGGIVDSSGILSGPLAKDEVLGALYQASAVNTYLASYVPILKELVSLEPIRNLVLNAFRDFVEERLMCFDQWTSHRIAISGGVASTFEGELRAVLGENGCSDVVICSDPLEELVVAEKEKGR